MGISETLGAFEGFDPNSPIMYILYGVIIAFVIFEAVFYLVKSLRRAKAIGMESGRIKKIITTSISFSVLPAVGIGIGLVTLVGALGIAFPAIRLSVIGSLQYETQMADGAAQAMTGAVDGMAELIGKGIGASEFVTMAALMTVAIISGPLLVLFFCKKFQPKVAMLTMKGGSGGKANFGETAFQIAFIGMIIGYAAMSVSTIAGAPKTIASYYNFIAIVVAAIFMYVCELLMKIPKMKWLDNFSTAFSMLIAMGVVAVIGFYAQQNGCIAGALLGAIL